MYSRFTQKMLPAAHVLGCMALTCRVLHAPQQGTTLCTTQGTKQVVILSHSCLAGSFSNCMNSSHTDTSFSFASWTHRACLWLVGVHECDQHQVCGVSLTARALLALTSPLMENLSACLTNAFIRCARSQLVRPVQRLCIQETWPCLHCCLNAGKHMCISLMSVAGCSCSY